MNDHPINLAETKILQRANRTMELVMKEALSIRTTPKDACFHRDSGYELLDCWIATFKKLKGRASLSSARRRYSHTDAWGARSGMRNDWSQLALMFQNKFWCTTHHNLDSLRVLGDHSTPYPPTSAPA